MSRSLHARTPTRRPWLKVLAKSQAGTAIILALITSMIVTGVAPAHAAPEDHSEARGQLLDANLLGVDLAEAASSSSALPSSPGRERNPLNIDLLNENVELDLGGGLQLPLIGENSPGLLQLGQLGAAQSYAYTVDPTQSIASAGTITEDGAIAVDPSQQTGDPARVDLTMLFEQLDVEGLTNQVIDEAGLNIGAIASRAESNSGEITRDYAIADLSLDLSSPSVANLTTLLGDVVDDLGTTVNSIVTTEGLLGEIVSGLEAIDIDLRPLARIGVTDASLGLDGVDQALNAVKNDVLQGTITSDTGLVSIDLDTGNISVNLEQIMDGGLNNQPANTQLINEETVELITTELTLTLSNLATKLRNSLIEALDEIELVVDLGLEARLLLPLATGGATITGSLAEFLGLSEMSPDIDVDLSLLGLNLDALLEPLLSGVLSVVGGAVGTVLNPLIDGLQGTIDTVIAGVLDPLSPVLSGVIEQLAQITINEQETTQLSGHEAHYVTALSLTLLPQAQAVNLDLATSTVRALEEYADVVITAPGDDEVIWDDEIEVTGTAQPGVEVTVELDGQTTTVTTDGDGFWSTTFTDVSPGEQIATATDDVSTDTVSFAVRVPVEITFPSNGDQVPGDTVPVTGAAEPGTAVTVTLCLEGADCQNPDVPAQSAQADVEGNWSVEFTGVPPGAHTATAADEFDDDEVTFQVVYSPAIQLDPDSVIPGTTTTVTGHGFAAGEDVVITLPEREVDGEIVSGLEVTTTANENGEISVALEVPTDYPIGEIEVTAVGSLSNTPTEASLIIMSPPTFEMPLTGGPGDWLYASLGGLIFVLAIGFGVVHHRRKAAAYQL